MKTLEKDIQLACNRIAPLWPLRSFVAVNPFLGFTNAHFHETALYFKQVQDAEMTMPLEWYHKSFEEGKIGQDDLLAVISRAPKDIRDAFKDAEQTLDVESLLESEVNAEDENAELYRPGAFSAYIDGRLNTNWQHIIRQEAAKWCAAYYDKGQSGWPLPWKSEDFYEAWRDACVYDRNLACAGLKDASKTLSALPMSPREAIQYAITEMSIPNDMVEEWLYRVLLILPGWAGHTRYLDREKELRGESGNACESLLAALLSYELVLHHKYAADQDCRLGWRRILFEEPAELGHGTLSFNLAKRLLWQGAYEHSIEQVLRGSFDATNTKGKRNERPEIQAAFCIDVRSEPYRRHLEASEPALESMGYAGFFGIPVDHQANGENSTQARCPGLLAPPVRSHDEAGPHQKAADQRQSSLSSSKRFKESSVSCFNFVETLGLTYLGKLFKDSLGMRSKEQPQSGVLLANNVDLATRINLAAGVVQGLGLHNTCAPLVLLCGHGSETRNNPYASGLDCGACGGHAGDTNARLAVALLNDPRIREGLKAQNLGIPADTFFVAGKHNTTTDHVELFDLARTEHAHTALIQKLENALNKASFLNAAQRSPSLGYQGKRTSEEVIHRSSDWSQTRPEWGLAGNASFIVAPRRWTQDADLKGRSFLHDYEPDLDIEGTLLESIIGGPMVVGSWINLQYFASSSDNSKFGSGHKSIHNVVGGLGIALGNESDLRPGLPIQSIHNGEAFVHEPSRLHVCIAAEPEQLDIILEKQPEVAALVRNEWIYLFALGRDGRKWERCLQAGVWSKPLRYPMKA